MKSKFAPLNKVKLVKEIGRQRVGPPKPVKVLKSKKAKRLDKAIVKDMLEDLT